MTSKFHSWVLTKSSEKLSSHKNLYMNVYSKNWKQSKSQLVNG